MFSLIFRDGLDGVDKDVLKRGPEVDEGRELGISMTDAVGGPSSSFNRDRVLSEDSKPLNMI
jgi:hypothetical protein